MQPVHTNASSHAGSGQRAKRLADGPTVFMRSITRFRAHYGSPVLRKSDGRRRARACPKRTEIAIMGDSAASQHTTTGEERQEFFPFSLSHGEAIQY